MNPRSWLVAGLLVITLLPACGFHLRGTGASAASIQAERIMVAAAEGGMVARELRAQLQLAGVRVVNARKDAEYVLRVTDEELQRDVLSVSPRTGKAEEYELTLTVLLTIVGPEREVLVDAERISLVRDFTFDQDAALGKFSEEELLTRELTRETVDQILRRLSAAIENNPR